MLALMAIPELDLARIRRWAERQVPAHARDQLRIEAEVDGHRVTVVERRPHFRDPDIWTSTPVARLRYTATRGEWTLYWRDRNLKFHRYQNFPATTHAQEILDFLDSMADPIFWG